MQDTRVCHCGLTLVELVITIILTAIVGIPVGILLAEHLTGALRARDYTVAMNLARHELERLDSLNNFCHADLDLTPGVPAPTPDSVYLITRIVSCQTPMSNCACSCSGACGTGTPTNARNDIKRVEIEVTKSGSGERVATLVSYRTKYVLFGP